ncbi:MAG: hypothetical protein LBD67_09195, partial [Candidatus Accumulibacter sp.]|nr:hypothetical protein [Accumulibacter sp.]
KAKIFSLDRFNQAAQGLFAFTANDEVNIRTVKNAAGVQGWMYATKSTISFPTKRQDRIFPDSFPSKSG